MIINRILHFAARVSMGKELAMALVLLRLIVEAIRDRKVSNVARFVYEKLPKSWKSPKGPASETEFLEMAHAGQMFLQKIKAVIS